MDLQKKLKVALNDNRLLILGTQVLFGFQFNGIFQELFVELPYPSRVLEACGLTLLMISIAFLVAPSMHHRLVEGGQDNARVLRLATKFAGFALLPLTFALAFDMFVAVAWTLGPCHGNHYRCDVFPCGDFILVRSRISFAEQETGHD